MLLVRGRDGTLKGVENRYARYTSHVPTKQASSH
jgi:hypothetical protein